MNYVTGYEPVLEHSQTMEHTISPTILCFATQVSDIPDHTVHATLTSQHMLSWLLLEALCRDFTC